MTGDGGLVEVQATAERTPLSRAHLDDLLALAARRDRRRCARCRTQTVATPLSRCAIPAPLVLATRNPHKLREFERLLAPGGDRRSSRCPTGSSCRPRTATRSRTTRCRRRAPRPRRPGGRRSPTTRGSRPRRSVARPGVRSARYAGEQATDQENLDKLIREAPAGSGLRYVCALAYVDPGHGDRAGLLRPHAAAGCRREPRGRARVRLRPGVPARRAISATGRWPS